MRSIAGVEGQSAGLDRIAAYAANILATPGRHIQSAPLLDLAHNGNDVLGLDGDNGVLTQGRQDIVLQSPPHPRRVVSRPGTALLLIPPPCQNGEGVVRIKQPLLLLLFFQLSRIYLPASFRLASPAASRASFERYSGG